MNPSVHDPIRELTAQVLAELTACVQQVPKETMAQAGALISAAPRIFVAGAGRSGLCMRAFAMRLMHLGKSVYVVSETTTPSIGASDLLIIGSGSGRTTSLLAMAERSRREGAKILLFTADTTSPLADAAEQLVLIPAPLPKKLRKAEELTSAQPLATLFEQSLLIVTDTLVLDLMRRSGESASDMAARHANLE